MLSGGVLVVAGFFGSASSLDKGLVGHWKFDGTAEDATPNSNGGTVTGASLTTDRKAQSNKAYDFSGTGQYIEVADNDSFSIGNNTVDSPFSISLWV